jgi:hypothetical protein
MSTDIEVVPTDEIGKGAFKIAYSVEKSTSPPKEYNYKIPSTSDPANFVIVIYKNNFDIAKYIKTRDPVFVTFKNMIDSDPELKFYIKHILNYNQTDTRFISYKNLLTSSALPGEQNFSDIIKKGEDYVKTFKNLDDFRDLRNTYIKNEDLFDCVNELTELFDLGDGGSLAAGGGGSAAGGGGGGNKLSPQLFGISVNTSYTNSVEKPFSLPSDIYSEIDKIIASIAASNQSSNHTIFRISYLIEKCGTTIKDQYKSALKKGEENQFLRDMGNAINAFVEKFVNTKNKLHGDLKIENLCPDYSKTPIEVNLLDVDPNYSISNDGDPEFSKHAKVFMKFLVFAHADKYYGILFPEWFVTKQEVDDMIVFFYQKKYLKFVFNPVNMLFYYLYKKAHFYNYSTLLIYYSPQIPDRMSSLKLKFQIPQYVINVGISPSVFKLPGGGKKTKKRNSRKRKTNKKRT